ncbi:family 2 encapsulin nanocompartment cargo protein polyprenyl transferase [Stackebrandtia nassauensis]|uniref:Polyprenyl synthetase n=1 Tax=Stackebrandtia nassauensis (strain DSM 44728 / CIP 108903 / NRRL B-16338 / NBRC 102104 / LLR-40K-21) TaxID=446470 RepID=D3Q7X0_STANL|nr:family 2 encapsulin nanocompartment cargo protein polyprenyl transferase [Stackebrandtia nassauensis]ADD40475.1 Polyprenyl synthetase [Stackebrandtia nassauensis DSM 44728]
MDTIDVIPGSRSAREILSHSRTLVDPGLRAAVDTLPPPTRHIAGYHFGWWDENAEPAEHKAGKAIRPALVLLCARAVGSSDIEALPAAVAVELVHNFSLVHDDVIDRDVTRRHRPTAWSVFGDGAAILAGDAMSTLACAVLADSGHPAAMDGIKLVNRAIQELIDGQHADVSFETREQIDPQECRAMAAAKTGALLGCACAIGARFGGGSPHQVERLRAFGTDLGLAFQHVDDLLGIWGDPQATGKPVYSDLRSRKKSLPVVAALASDSPAAAALSSLYSGTEPLRDEEITRAAALIEEAGGRQWSSTEAAGLLDRALASLAEVGAEESAASDLTTLARLVTRRDR